MPTDLRKTVLLAVDQQQSAMNAVEAGRSHTIAYSPYGYHPRKKCLISLLGFNGERPDPLTGHYHLGNGYRQFNAVLMRFNRPDSWSPFGAGGINAYAYCEGDPRNRVDPTGHTGLVNRLFSQKKPKTPGAPNSTPPTSRKTKATPGLALTKETPLQSARDYDIKFSEEERIEQAKIFEQIKKSNNAQGAQGPTPTPRSPARTQNAQRISVETLTSQKSEELRPSLSNYSQTQLLAELANVQSRLKKPGPSSDILIEGALQNEIIRRTH